MDVLDLVLVSRWQFGITTIYHYIFVPLTLGLAPLVALMETMWVKTNAEKWLRATKFFGNLFLINFAMGVVTGIVQEFQFGMNWSEYSKFVGDVFGAPLALEGLAAFFFESIFLGVWIFGWGRVPKWLHLTAMWMVAIATHMSAYFIIVANSFMQHPVGAKYNPETGRAELENIWELLTNSTALNAFPHAIFGGWLFGATFVTGIAGWWMVKEGRRRTTPNGAINVDMWRTLTRMGAWAILVSVVLLSVTGHSQAQLMFEQQPMKMASAEALCETTTDPNFSILSLSFSNSCQDAVKLIGVPFVLSFLAQNQFSGVTLQGVNDLQAQYEQLYGPGDYSPDMFVTYWSFRLMIFFMVIPLIMAVVGLWLTRKKKVPRARWVQWACLWALPAPFAGNMFGWVFTEMGRQPWVVHPNPEYGPETLGDKEQIHLLVDAGVSDHAPWVVLTSLIIFTLLYGVLAVVWYWLLRKHVLDGTENLDLLSGQSDGADGGNNGGDAGDGLGDGPGGRGGGTAGVLDADDKLVFSQKQDVKEN